MEFGLTFFLQDFVDKRVYVLGQLGITTALVALCKTESKNIKELIARVLNAVCNVQVKNGIDGMIKENKSR